jgi:electron transport complex protein RnfC
LNINFKMKTFRGGVHPPEFKKGTRDKPAKEARVPQRVIIPLLQHTGAPCEPLVEVGQKVKAGEKIGESKSFISAPVHASISGKVAAIKEHPHPLGPEVLSVIIEKEGEPEESAFRKGEDWEKLSPEEIRDIIRSAGIVGLGGAAFPTSVKLSPPQGKPVDTLILNGAECEPYVTCDERLMLQKSHPIIEGLKIMMKAVSVRQAVIGIENNKPSAIEVMAEASKSCKAPPQAGKNIKVVSLKTKYPQGAEKQLIKAILGREIPSGGLPFDVGVIVQNVGTALAVQEAVVEGKPLIERVITVSGGAVAEPQNLKVRIGTLFSQVIEECGGLKGEPGKVIMGGPMMGLAQCTLNVPVIKGTSGILVFPQGEVLEEVSLPCIRCGNCVDSCPLNLIPTLIESYAGKERFKEAEILGALDCIECGACSYVCPSKRPLVQMIKYAKLSISSPLMGEGKSGGKGK